MVELFFTELNDQKRAITRRLYIEQYVCYIQTKYGHFGCIVFDSYECDPLTKEHEHQRKIRNTCADKYSSKWVKDGLKQPASFFK